jgi:hypothetical protein
VEIHKLIRRELEGLIRRESWTDEMSPSNSLLISSHPSNSLPSSHPRSPFGFHARSPTRRAGCAWRSSDRLQVTRRMTRTTSRTRLVTRTLRVALQGQMAVCTRDARSLQRLAQALRRRSAGADLI